jgi:hypothetical protein
MTLDMLLRRAGHTPFLNFYAPAHRADQDCARVGPPHLRTNRTFANLLRPQRPNGDPRVRYVDVADR